MYISESFINGLLESECVSDCACSEGVVPICEQVQFVEEGLGTLFIKIGEWFTNYRPKDPDFRRLRDRKRLDYSRCDDRFREFQSKNEIQYEGSKDDWNTKVTYDGYRRRPEYETCTMLSEYRFLKDTVELIKKKKNKLCVGNMNVENCQKWIVTNLPELEDELKFLDGMLRSMGKDRGTHVLNAVLS